ncbi:MAG TPA: hypothetical protein VL485_16280 [Ktedonobacteraceae bacterium]|nr:hypothetical protein [Ktedonobacteraceae bacterium]
MKITVGPISFDILLFLRLWLPAIVFIGLCIGIILAFNPVLQILDQIAPGFIGGAWLLLLIFYILLGVAFTHFVARLLRRSFGSEEWRIQRRMVILSGFPFYALCLFFLTVGIVILLDTDLHSVEMIGAALVFYLAGSLLFALTSCGYVILTLFFLRRSTAIAHQEEGK